MKVLVIILAAVVLFLVWVVYFLGTEHLRKFHLLQQFSSSLNVVRYHFDGVKRFRDKGMKNIVLRSEQAMSFTALCTAEFPTFWGSGMDPVSVGKSSPEGILVVSAFFGKGPCDLYFIINDPQVKIHVTATPDDQKLSPSTVMPPHWVHWLL